MLKPVERAFDGLKSPSGTLVIAMRPLKLAWKKKESLPRAVQ